MDTLIVFVLIFLSIILVIPVFAEEIPNELTINQMENYQEEKNFIIYYGELNDEIIQKLSSFDVVILEPRNTVRSDILKLKDLGPVVYGYLSVVEQNENNLEFVSLRNDWFYKKAGQKIRNDQWGSYYMDLGKKGYQRFLLEQVFLHGVDKGLDGIFIDTVGDIDEMDFSDIEKRKMIQGYMNLLNTINTNYPDMKIIQNWGINIAREHSAPLIDGIMWEGFSYELLDSDEWSRNRFEEIKSMSIDFYKVAYDNIKGSNLDFKNDIYHFNWETSIYDEIK